MPELKISGARVDPIKFQRTARLLDSLRDVNTCAFYRQLYDCTNRKEFDLIFNIVRNAIKAGFRDPEFYRTARDVCIDQGLINSAIDIVNDSGDFLGPDRLSMSQALFQRAYNATIDKGLIHNISMVKLEADKAGFQLDTSGEEVKLLVSCIASGKTEDVCDLVEKAMAAGSEDDQFFTLAIAYLSRKGMGEELDAIVSYLSGKSGASAETHPTQPPG